MDYSKIEKLRKLRKLTQVELSKLSNITEGAYQKIISGRSDTKVSTLEKISKALGVEPGYFFTNEKQYQIVEESSVEYSKDCKECSLKNELIKHQKQTIKILETNNNNLIEISKKIKN